MEDDTLELPLLPLREGELEERLNEMDTTQVKFMIPRIAMLTQGSARATPRISQANSVSGLDSEELAMVRPNAEVIREIREIKKLQFRCGVAIVLVMIVGVLVLACGIGFIIFHAAKMNRQLELGTEKLQEANDYLQNEAKPLLDHVKNTLDEGIGHIDILVNTQMENLMRVLDGDRGLEADPAKDAVENKAKLMQRVIGGVKIGNRIVNHNARRDRNPEQTTGVLKTVGSMVKGAASTTGNMVKGAATNAKNFVLGEGEKKKK